MTSFESRTIVLTLPLAPPVDIGLNRRSHWSVHGETVADLRAAAAGFAKTKLPSGWRPFTGLLEVSVYVMFPDGQRLPDIDNVVGCCKPIFDGFQDAHVYRNDNQIRRYGEWEIDNTGDGQGWTRIAITEYAPKTRRRRR